MKAADILSLYVHTIRHLNPRQVIFRLIRRFSSPTLRQRSGPVTCRSDVALKPVIPRTMSFTDDFVFRFLNTERHFFPQDIDWQPEGVCKLWRYNLHYFDYLQQPERSEENVRTLIDSWITSNAPGTVDAWEPFPLSLRIVNWIKYFLTSRNRTKIEYEWLESLYGQTLWLEQTVEYHLLANHYFKNGKALIFAGLYFSGDEADRWLRKGVNIISRELAEQVLPDGGHFERSPMYHAMILEDCLDLYNLTRERPERDVRLLAEKLRVVIPRMLRFLLGTAHPDGDISLFNDAAFGTEACPQELASYWEWLTGSRLSVPTAQCWSFSHTGYFVMAPTAADRLIIDCGAVGPDYQPGHAHCDTLSFELSLKEKRVIVDSGCGQYHGGDIRRYNRGNIGHNTLTIDGLNQSEVWGAHRCARRARPLYAALEQLQDGTLRFSGAHDGYRRLPGKPVHRRTVTWSDAALVIEDLAEGSGCHDLVLRLHINPELNVLVLDGKAVISDDGRVSATITALAAGVIELAEGRYCPEFGRLLPCPLLLVSYPKIRLPFRCGWLIEIPNL